MPTDERQAATHELAADSLKAHGHRYSSARRRIVEALLTIDGPVTIPQLVDVDSGLAISSAYRNLAVLEESGVAARVVTPDDHARFELAEQVTRHHHHHMICTDCGDVLDFELPESFEKSLDRELHRAGRSATFSIDRHHLDLIGTCSDCS